MVVVLEAGPVAAELLEAALVDVVDDAAGAARHPPTLLEALELALARVLVLALHVVIVVVLAPRTDEERGREQGGRAGADLFDFGDRVREGRRVVEDLLVEAGVGLAWCERRIAAQLRRNCRHARGRMCTHTDLRAAILKVWPGR